MTTARSPFIQLKRQADKIAATLKAATPTDKPTFKAGIVMDDKVITIELSWAQIAEMSKAELSGVIVDQMQRDVGPRP